MSEREAILNPRLVIEKGVTKEKQEAIKALHTELDKLRLNPVSVESLIRNAEIQYEQQRLWGFEENCNYHQWAGIWAGENNTIFTVINQNNNQLYIGEGRLSYRIVESGTPFYDYMELLVKQGKATQIPATTMKKCYKDYGYDIHVYYCQP